MCASIASSVSQEQSSEHNVLKRSPLADKPAQGGWDMHCHTVFSDGTYTPKQMIEQAQSLGLEGIAICDHDTSQGWDQAASSAQETGIGLVFGTEITADFDRVSVHMLAYEYDKRRDCIAEMFAQTRAARLKRTRTMVEKISRDYPIDWDSVLAQVKEGERTTVGRPHIADALVAAGVYATRSEAFAGIVSSSSTYYIPTPSPDARDVVHAVKDAGGVCVIAHPADRSRNRVLLSDEQIIALVDLGLDGLEVWHRGNSIDQRKRLLYLVEHYGLLATGGSDWHGLGKPNTLGECLTDSEVVQEIMRRGVRGKSSKQQ